MISKQPNARTCCDGVLYRGHACYMFRPLIWSSSGKCITDDSFIYIAVLPKCSNQWPQHVRCMPWVWHTVIHLCALVNTDIVLIGFIWHRREFNGSATYCQVLSIVYFHWHPWRHEVPFTETDNGCRVSVHCVLLSVAGSSWVHWQTDRQTDRQTERRRTAVSCGKLPTECFGTAGEQTAANCTECVRRAVEFLQSA